MGTGLPWSPCQCRLLNPLILLDLLVTETVSPVVTRKVTNAKVLNIQHFSLEKVTPRICHRVTVWLPKSDLLAGANPQLEQGVDAFSKESDGRYRFPIPPQTFADLDPATDKDVRQRFYSAARWQKCLGSVLRRLRKYGSAVILPPQPIFQTSPPGSRRRAFLCFPRLRFAGWLVLLAVSRYAEGK